jgi:putative Mg2+ transporter-C (MgtC) family protein
MLTETLAGPGTETELIFLTRLIIAGAFAGVLGWEREHAKKPAGFRTHIIVGIGAALFTVLGEITFLRDAGAASDWRSDPTRVIQAVATGIGFLGSGIIFVGGTGPDRQVRGLTTAASIWTTAAIGMTCGLGLYTLAAGSTLLLLVVLRGLGRFERVNGD